jgi:hypothetical protein
VTGGMNDPEYVSGFKDCPKGWNHLVTENKLAKKQIDDEIQISGPFFFLL